MLTVLLSGNALAGVPEWNVELEGDFQGSLNVVCVGSAAHNAEVECGDLTINVGQGGSVSDEVYEYIDSVRDQLDAKDARVHGASVDGNELTLYVAGYDGTNPKEVTVDLQALTTNQGTENRLLIEAVDAALAEESAENEATNTRQDDAITALKGEVNSQGAALEQVVTEVTTQGEDINTLAGAVSDIEQEQVVQNQAISNVSKVTVLNSNRIQTNTNDIRDLKGNVASNTENIVQVAEFAGENRVLIQNTYAEIDKTNERVGTLETQYVELEETVYAVKGQVDRNTQDVSWLKNQIGTLSNDVSYLKGEVKRNKVNIVKAAAIGGLKYPSNHTGTYAVGVNLTNQRDTNAIALGLKGEKTELFNESDAGLVELAVAGSDSDGFDDIITQVTVAYGF